MTGPNTGPERDPIVARVLADAGQIVELEHARLLGGRHEELVAAVTTLIAAVHDLLFLVGNIPDRHDDAACHRIVVDTVLAVTDVLDHVLREVER